MRPLLPALAALILCSCGYIGDPLPPLANVPGPVNDLAAIQRGGLIIAHFTVPQLTTEQQKIPGPITLDLRIGTNPSDHFEANEWASRARHIVSPEITGPLATYEIPTAEWTGKEVILSVRVTAANGKQNNWSNFVIIPVLPPLAVPRNVTPTATAQGVHLTWTASGAQFRVLRKVADATEYSVAATVTAPEWTDTATEFGTRYSYMVQTIVPLDNNRTAESDLSAEATLTPVDTFPPAAPAGLRATVAPTSIELAWEPSPAPDLASYRIYRSAAGGPFERLADAPGVPAYSDRAVEAGKSYRYAVTAVDRAGNESPRSAPAEAALR